MGCPTEDITEIVTGKRIKCPSPTSIVLEACCIYASFIRKTIDLLPVIKIEKRKKKKRSILDRY